MRIPSVSSYPVQRPLEYGFSQFQVPLTSQGVLLAQASGPLPAAASLPPLLLLEKDEFLRKSVPEDITDPRLSRKMSFANAEEMDQFLGESKLRLIVELPGQNSVGLYLALIDNMSNRTAEIIVDALSNSRKLKALKDPSRGAKAILKSVKAFVDLNQKIHAEINFYERIIYLNGRRGPSNNPIQIPLQSKQILTTRIQELQEFLYQSYQNVVGGLLKTDTGGLSRDLTIVAARTILVTGIADEHEASRIFSAKQRIRQEEGAGGKERTLNNFVVKLRSVLAAKWYQEGTPPAAVAVATPPVRPTTPTPVSVPRPVTEDPLKGLVEPPAPVAERASPPAPTAPSAPAPVAAEPSRPAKRKVKDELDEVLDEIFEGGAPSSQPSSPPAAASADELDRLQKAAIKPRTRLPAPETPPDPTPSPVATPPARAAKKPAAAGAQVEVRAAVDMEEPEVFKAKIPSRLLEIRATFGVGKGTLFRLTPPSLGGRISDEARSSHEAAAGGSLQNDASERLNGVTLGLQLQLNPLGRLFGSPFGSLYFPLGVEAGFLDRFVDGQEDPVGTIGSIEAHLGLGISLMKLFDPRPEFDLAFHALYLRTGYNGFMDRYFNAGFGQFGGCVRFVAAKLGACIDYSQLEGSQELATGTVTNGLKIWRFSLGYFINSPHTLP